MERSNVLPLQKTRNAAFIRKVEQRSGQQVAMCYQCGNCSASCAYTYVYDYPVNQIMRLVQLGQRETVLGSHSIWLCASCLACTTRCPCNIDVAGIMKTLRAMSVEEGFHQDRDIRSFYEEFLKSVKTFGRIFETGLLGQYNLRMLKPFTDLDLAPPVLKKGKMALWPRRIKGRGEVAQIFERFEAYRKEKQGKP